MTFFFRVLLNLNKFNLKLYEKYSIEKMYEIILIYGCLLRAKKL